MAEENPRMDHFGLPVQQERTTETAVGRRKTFAGLQRSEWCFVIISVLNILLTLIITLVRFIYQLKHDEQFAKSADFTFGLLIIINSAFCLLYVVNGVFREREFELYALAAAISVILIYCVIEYSVNRAGHTDLKLGRLIAACILAPPNIFLCIYVAREFGWLEFKIVGASETFQLMYRDAARLSSLLKFEIQLSFSLVILILRDGTNLDHLEIAVLAAGIPLSIILGLIGWVSVRFEKKWLVGVYFVTSLTFPAYVLYRLVETLESLKKETKTTTSEDVIVYTVIGAGFFGLILQIVIYFELWRCYKNFGKGLRERDLQVAANETTGLLAQSARA